MLFLSLLFWAFLASFVVHILDESPLNGGFVEWIRDNFWPTYRAHMFFWFTFSRSRVRNSSFRSSIAFKEPTRFSRQQQLSSRGSSTRGCRSEPLHRCASGALGGRADLPDAAGCHVDVLRSEEPDALEAERAR